MLFCRPRTARLISRRLVSENRAIGAESVEKRFQVFVSSTYEDLQDERQEVMHALLELDCIPSGMELFPAANEDQWSVIKGVIDDCDYYLVIVGGRYGSIGPNGQSYTEMEYRYAVEAGKPCLAFVHADPGTLAANKTEKTDAGKEKLAVFRAMVQERLCKSWRTPADLGSVVSRSLIRLMKSTPAIGWVRGDAVPDEGTAKEIVRLRRRVEELEDVLAKSAMQAPSGTEDLAQGADSFRVSFEAGSYAYADNKTKGSVGTTWNELFARLAPLMIDEASEEQLRAVIGELIKESGRGAPTDKYVRPMQESFGAIIVQLRALGLIVRSERKRSLKDTSTYWALTSYGDAVMTRLLAIKK